MDRKQVSLLYDGTHYRFTIPKRVIAKNGWNKGDRFWLEEEVGGLKIKRVRLKTAKPVVFSVGYEGKKIAEFVELLNRTGVRQLIDVREIPFSYKDGFSKLPLKQHLNNAGISYYNIKELGTEKKSRDEYKKTGDIKKLCDDFSKRLIENIDQYEMLLALVGHKPSAVMCFEDDYRTCHRQVLENRLEADGYSITHLSNKTVVSKEQRVLF